MPEKECSKKNGKKQLNSDVSGVRKYSYLQKLETRLEKFPHPYVCPIIDGKQRHFPDMAQKDGSSSLAA